MSKRAREEEEQKEGQSNKPKKIAKAVTPTDEIATENHDETVTPSVPMEKEDSGEEDSEGFEKEDWEDRIYTQYIDGMPLGLRSWAQEGNDIYWKFKHKGTTLAYAYVKNVIDMAQKAESETVTRPEDHEPDLSSSIRQYPSLNFNFVPENKQGSAPNPPLVALILDSHIKREVNWIDLLKTLDDYRFQSINWSDDLANSVLSIAFNSDLKPEDEDYHLLLSTLEKLVSSPFNPIKNVGPSRMRYAAHWAKKGRPIVLNKLLTFPSSVLQTLPWTVRQVIPTEEKTPSTAIQDLADLFFNGMHPSTLIPLAQLEKPVVETLQKAYSETMSDSNVNSINFLSFSLFLSFLLQLDSALVLTSIGGTMAGTMAEPHIWNKLQELQKSPKLYSKGCFCIAKRIEKHFPSKAEEYYQRIPIDSNEYSFGQRELASLYFTTSSVHDSKENSEQKNQNQRLEKALTAGIHHWYCEAQRSNNPSLMEEEKAEEEENTQARQLVEKIICTMLQPTDPLEGLPDEWQRDLDRCFETLADQSTSVGTVKLQITTLLQAIALFKEKQQNAHLTQEVTRLRSEVAQIKQMLLQKAQPTSMSSSSSSSKPGFF